MPPRLPVLHSWDYHKLRDNYSTYILQGKDSKGDQHIPPWKAALSVPLLHFSSGKMGEEKGLTWSSALGELALNKENPDARKESGGKSSPTASSPLQTPYSELLRNAIV